METVLGDRVWDPVHFYFPGAKAEGREIGDRSQSDLLGPVP
jgi:hypothetical protein